MTSNKKTANTKGSHALNALLILLSLYTLYIAHDLLMPILLAVMFSMLLAPAMLWLVKHRINRSLAAFLVLFTAIGCIVFSGWQLAEPAMQWLDELPKITKSLVKKTAPLQDSLAELNSATSQVEKLQTSVIGTPDTTVVTVSDQADDFDVLALLQEFSGQVLLTLTLTFFLLSTGDLTLRNLRHILPGNIRQREILVTAGRIRIAISSYLLRIFAVNTTLGVCTGFIMWLLDMPTPWLWGTLAGLLNFIPYIGSIITASLLAIVATHTFSNLQDMILPPLIFMLLTSIEGLIASPFLHAQFTRINPVLIFLSIFFWGWLWGAAGVLLAVPLIVVFKVVCNHVPQLNHIALFMDTNTQPRNK